jgi:hypothetical protein
LVTVLAISSASAATPTLSSLSPAFIPAAGPTFTLTVNGSGFLSGAIVQWNGSALVTSFVSGTQVTASVPANLILTSGTANVTVVNPGTAASSALTFSINPQVINSPVILSLSPSSAVAGGTAFTITVFGSGFISNFVGTSTVQWNGSALATNFVNGELMTASVPASLVATAGSASVTVQNPDGAVSNPSAFTIGPVSSTPTITNLSPGQATAAGAAFTLTVSGSGFVSGAAVQWNGAALATSFVSGAQLSASVPASLIATAGTASITVQNPAGAISSPVTFTISSQGLSFTTALRLAHIVDGGGWTTLFAIENLDVVPVNYAFNFWGDNGAALPIPLANGSPGVLSGTLAVGAISFVQTPGTSATLLEGWAEAASSGQIGVSAIFRYVAPGVPDSEGSVIGTTSGSSLFMPYDNTQGYITGVAVVNTNPAQAITVSLLFETDAGVQSNGQINLPAHGHMAFELPNTFQTTAGTRGSIHLTTTSADLAVLGLRFTPSFSFASFGAFQ